MTKISKVILFLFTLICLFCYIGCVKADTINFNAQNITYSAYNIGYTAGTTCANGHCNISGNSFIVQNIDIKFKPNQYWGYPNYLLIFSINTITSTGNMTITANALTDDNYNTIGTCESYTNSTGQITQLTAICRLSDNVGLKNGFNILRLGASSVYSNNNLTFTMSMNPVVYMTTSASCDKTCMSSIANTINLNNNTNTNAIVYAINNLTNSNTNITNAINNQSTQNHQDNQNINNSIQDTNNTLKDSSIDNPSSSTSSWANKNATNGVITNLLTLPIKLMQGYVNGMNSTCSAFNLGTLFGTEIILPCINVSNLIGSSLWNVIDVLFSGFMIFAIGKKLIKIFNDFTNMKSNQVDELYGGGA